MQSLAILALSGCVGFIVVTIPLLLCSKTKKRPNDDTTSVLPAKLPTKDPVPAAAPTIVTNTPKEDNMLDRTQKENGHIADIHKTMKLRRKGSKKTKEAGFNVEGQKKEFEQIFKAMDCKVNTSILDRLARHKASDTTQDHSHSTASKSEDIRFTFSARRKKGNDEDTVYPKKKSSQTTPGAKSDPKANAAEDACNTPNADEEFFEDDGDEEPNDQNYMYNYREIYYVGHEMIRTLLSADLNDVTGDCTVEKINENVKWNPYLPIAELEKRDQFCQLLRKNTFLSNSLCMPTIEEKKAVEKLKLTEPAPSKVVVKPQPQDLSKLNSLVRENSLKTATSQFASHASKRTAPTPATSNRQNQERRKHSSTKKKRESANN